MQVIVNGMLTHYERAGSGRTVLIVPGWADTSQSWLPVQKLLQEAYDVIVVDLPGFGGSAAPEAAWGLKEYARFLKVFLSKLSVDELYGLVGHSNGGAISMTAMADRELTAEKLVLIASAGIRGEASGRQSALRVAAKAGKVLTAPLPKGVKQKLRAQLYQRAGSDLLVAEHMQETFKRIVSQDVRSEAAKLQVPTYILYGSKDTSTPPSFGETFHELIRSSKFEILDGADHFLHVRQPETVAVKLKGYLA